MYKILNIILFVSIIIVPINAKTISFNFGQEFTYNMFGDDGQTKGLAPGSTMGFNLHMNDALSVGFISSSGDNDISWDENYLGFTYNIFDFVGLTFGVGQTTNDTKMATRTGIKIPLFNKKEKDFFSNLTMSIEAGYKQDISAPRVIFSLGTNFGF